MREPRSTAASVLMGVTASHALSAAAPWTAHPTLMAVLAVTAFGSLAVLTITLRAYRRVRAAERGATAEVADRMCAEEQLV